MVETVTNLPPVGRRPGLLAAAIALTALLVAYWPSIRGEFLFDDVPSIVENGSIRTFATAWFPPPGGTTASGRPLLNASFALNHALSGLNPWSYHVVNGLIHAAAAFTLFAVVRRTLQTPAIAGHFGAAAERVAFWTAVLWALHPLQVEAVTYVVQRAESLAALFILLTLYGVGRGASGRHSGLWYGGAALACLAGSATKETAAVTPLLVLLYDRCFLAGSWGGAWRARRRVYIALALSWLLVGWFVAQGRGRGGTAGFDSPASWWEYALLQFHAIPHYLRLALWPRPLVFDYGPFQSVPWKSVVAGALVVVPAVVATPWLLVRRPAAGFLAAAFFLLLAPSSSIVPITSQVMAEHRMYLPLASVMAGLVLAACCWLPPRIAPALLAALAVSVAILTWQRNRTFQSSLALWTDTVAGCPDNPRAHLNLGEAIARAGREAEATVHFEAALRLQPNYVAAHFNLGTAELAQRRPARAIAPLTRALELNPEFFEAAYNLGNAYAAVNRPAEAARCYAQSLRLQPGRANVHYNLANALVALGQLDAAIAEYRTALRLAPDEANAYFNLANALLQSRRPDEAIPCYEAVLRLDPRDRDAAANLAIARRDAMSGASRRPN